MKKLNKAASAACTVSSLVFLLAFFKLTVSYLPYILSYEKIYGASRSLIIFFVAAACMFLLCAVTCLSLGGEFESVRGEAGNKIIMSAALALFVAAGSYFYSKVALSPLFYALYKREPASAIEYLIENTADINKPEKGYSPLAFAVMYGHGTETIKLLIDKGADVNAADKEGIPVLVHALKPESSIDAVRVLVENGADVNKLSLPGKVSAIGRASLTVNDPEIIKLLIENGADLKTTSIDNFPVISAALMNKSKRKNEILKALLENGAPVNDSDKSGVTPLTYAYVSGNGEAAEMLIEKGAYIDPDGSVNRGIINYLTAGPDLSDEEKEERKKFIKAYAERVKGKKGYLY